MTPILLAIAVMWLFIAGPLAGASLLRAGVSLCNSLQAWMGWGTEEREPPFAESCGIVLVEVIIAGVAAYFAAALFFLARAANDVCLTEELLWIGVPLSLLGIMLLQAAAYAWMAGTSYPGAVSVMACRLIVTGGGWVSLALLGLVALHLFGGIAVQLPELARPPAAPKEPPKLVPVEPARPSPIPPSRSLAPAPKQSSGHRPPIRRECWTVRPPRGSAPHPAVAERAVRR